MSDNFIWLIVFAFIAIVCHFYERNAEKEVEAQDHGVNLWTRLFRNAYRHPVRAGLVIASPILICVAQMTGTLRMYIEIALFIGLALAIISGLFGWGPF